MVRVSVLADALQSMGAYRVARGVSSAERALERQESEVV
jgi:hypothetical protein